MTTTKRQLALEVGNLEVPGAERPNRRRVRKGLVPKGEFAFPDSDFDSAFSKVKGLVDDFRNAEAVYLLNKYQEQEVRKDFIDKFFGALGWDVNHDWQKNPFAQEVKVERNVSTVGSQRRADYAFFVAPNFRDVRFFVEAKKPSSELGTAQNYFQTVRYGWNAQTPIAIVTNFVQFHILDSRYKPDIDSALSQCIEKYHYTDYEDEGKFREIFHLFSREAVANGSLEILASGLTKKRGKAVQRGLFKGGYQSIDEAFLEELDDYRDTLARAFKNRNSDLDGETLTELTQKTLDRLVFIRFLEDKFILQQNLVADLGNKGTAWNDFIAECRRLDRIYNGVVFKPHSRLDSAGFQVDDKAFSGICEKLSHVNSPYDFNSIPIHILGSIYERFLGKVIVATDKRARVEEKPEVRKAGGVYYTPDYVVQYIVKETIGKLIEGKTPTDISEMRFADIACGSGSFLLGIYDLLLRYHRDWFNNRPARAKSAGCILRDDGAWHLSFKQRREILINNIFGVDIDPQAVEVAQLSLYLKLLEEETTATARQHQLEFHEALLPSLRSNITCGNSLVGTEQQFDRDLECNINPMDFTQRFPAVMKSHGFHAIVGNPPYSYRNSTEELLKPYFLDHYESAEGNFDIYKFFLERSSKLLRPGGKLGLIVSATFLVQPTFKKLRHFLLNTLRLEHLCPLGPNVFQAATVDTAIFTAAKEVAPADNRIQIVAPKEPTQLNYHAPYSILQKRFAQNPDQVFDYRLTDEGATLVKRLMDTLPDIESRYEFGVGINTGYIRDELVSKRKIDSRYHPMVPGSGISRYGVVTTDGWIMYDANYVRSRGKLGRTLPAEHLLSSEKILVVRTRNLALTRRVIATIDSDRNYNLNRLSNIIAKQGSSLLGLLGILNSSLFNWLFATRYFDYEIKPIYLRHAPLADSEDRRLIDLVRQILDANAELTNGNLTDRRRDFYANKCASLDRQIDSIVYELYGLSEKEIRMVEVGLP